MGTEIRHIKDPKVRLGNCWKSFVTIFLTITMVYLHNKRKNLFHKNLAEAQSSVPVPDSNPLSVLELPTVLPPILVEPDLPSERLDQLDPGMVEVSIALAAIATGIAVFLPSAEIVEDFKVLAAVLSSVLAAFSSYSALWFLTLYCLKNKNPLAFIILIGRPSHGPFWLLALAILILLGISLFLLTLVLVS